MRGSEIPGPQNPKSSTCENNHLALLDDRQITHLSCARLKYDLYDFLGGVFGPCIQAKEQDAGPKNP